ncbi:MAG: Tim44/TimA family putative adaptor protein [Sphingomonadaceae bacterium]|nr:Tim44/TimA family putative adaptor protein [Sphingomonadaceae bacterium]
MSDSGTWIEIVLLAMLAGFIGLRLVSVLGKRTGSEKAVGEPYRPTAGVASIGRARVETPVRREVSVPAGTDAGLAPALQAVADADPGFDPAKFIAGAQAAYRLILEAFWAGDAATMTGLVSDEVVEHFRVAIAHRETALPHRLVGVDAAAITAARLAGQMAELTVRFESRIATGDTTAAAHDVWTFSRHVGAHDPAWLLIATDAEA